MPPQMLLRLRCRKQPLDQLSLAAGDVRLFTMRASLISSHIPLSYMIGYSTRTIGYEGLSGQAVFSISCKLERSWRPQCITWILAYLASRHLREKGMEFRLFFSGGQHLNDLLRISHCICGRTRWGSDLVFEATPGRHDELLRLCSRQPGRQQ